MREQRPCRVQVVVSLCAVLAGLPLMTSHAQETDVDRQICRAHLRSLGSALGLYIQQNERRLPRKLSQLYSAGYVLEPGLFVCPGSQKQITSESQIDENTDFEIVAKIPAERPARLIWQKRGATTGLRLAFYSDGTIGEMKDPASVRVAGRGSSVGGGGVMAAATGGGGGFENRREGSEVEPNNRREEASAIEVGNAMRGTIAARADLDWYRLDVERQGALRVEIDKVPKDMELAFRVYDAKGVYVPSPVASQGKLAGYGWVSAEKPGDLVAGVADLPVPGTYYVEVKDRRNGRSEEPYELLLSFAPSADTAELNNSLANAAPIEVGKRLAANILPRGDLDWYWLTIGQPGALGVKIDKAPKEMELAFRVYDAKGVYVPSPVASQGKLAGYGWVSAERQGDAVAGVVDLPFRGTYYVEVKDRRNARSPEPYGLALSFVGTADDGEPDNDLAMASRMEVGQTVTATILPGGDVDWYRLDLDGQGVLGVKIDKSPANLGITFRVYDARGQYIGSEVSRGKARGYGWVAAQKEGEAVAAKTRVPGAGTYYLQVKAVAGNARSPEPYSFRTTFSSVR